MSTPLKIALVTAFPPGQQSLNEYGLHLANGLAKNHEVSEIVVVADRLSQAMDELPLDPKIRIIRRWNFNDPSASLSILKTLRRERPDGVLWNLQTASFGDREVPAALGLLAPALTRYFGMPSGVIAHNLISGIDLENTQLKGQKLRQSLVSVCGAAITRALLSASYMTVTLRSYLDHVLERFPNSNVHLVPHGTFDTQHTARRPIAQRPKQIVTMGKFGTYKRLETLLDAFDILRSNPQFADYKLIIGGSDHPGTPGYLEDLKAKRSFDSGVVLKGYIAEDDIPNFFSSARLSVFDYSATTGSSGVLHQTACYGTLPVFPHIGDFVDVCRDEGFAGANYLPNDAKGMASAISNMLMNPKRAESIAEANRVAASGMPFSNVVDFHISQFRHLQKRSTNSAHVPAST